MAVGATGCWVVDESVRDADAHFRIGWWALSEIAFDSVRVEFRAQAGRVPYNTFNLSATLFGPSETLFFYL